MRAQARRTETGDRLTTSWACTMPRSLQREAEDAGREYASGRFAREGETAPGRPTPTRRRRGPVPAEPSVATAPDAFAEIVRVQSGGSPATEQPVREFESRPLRRINRTATARF